MSVQKILLGSLFLGVRLLIKFTEAVLIQFSDYYPQVALGDSSCQVSFDVAPCMGESDRLPLGPGSVYEVASPRFPKKYPQNAR